MDIRYEGKVYKNVEDMSIEEVEHIFQLTKESLDRYANIIRNYTPDRQGIHGNPHLAKLTNESLKAAYLLEFKRRQQREVLVAIDAVCPTCNVPMGLGIAIKPKNGGCRGISVAPINKMITANDLQFIDVFKCPKCGYSNDGN